MIKVIFRKDKTGEIVAFFPELPGTPNAYADCLSYVHCGQHDAASLSYYLDTEPAQPEEYAELLAELQQIYEGELKPVLRISQADFKKRLEATRS